MVKINDTQEQAIWDAISKEHKELCSMYGERNELEKRHEEEIDNLVELISEQEEKVKELCKGRANVYPNSDNKLILDLTDREVKSIDSSPK